jgi:signal transduction histidine kinase
MRSSVINRLCFTYLLTIILLALFAGAVFVGADHVKAALTAGGDAAAPLRTLQLLAIAGIVLLVAAAVAAYLPLRYLRQRLAALADGTRQLGEGNLEHRVPADGRDEIAGLAGSFNTMAAQLQESNKALEAFAYTVSHDLRAPLRAMQGFAKALQEDYGEQLPPPAKNYTKRIVAAAERMDALIQDLLAYARLSRSDIAIERVPLDLAVETALQRMSESIVARGAVVEVVPPLPEVRAHRPTLQQCLINLISNALKFTPDGAAPRITLRAEKRAGSARLWIEDTGIGIAPEHHERIFNVFERLHGAETYPGTGIGLAIVKKGIERMDGQVGVASCPDQGSCFWIELPLERASAPARQPRPLPHGDHARV